MRGLGVGDWVGEGRTWEVGRATGESEEQERGGSPSAMLGGNDLGGVLRCRNRSQVRGVSQPPAAYDLRVTVGWSQRLPDFDGDGARPKH